MNTGWRLPTKDELAILNDNMEIIGGFDQSSWYWSGSESYSGTAWVRGFSDCFEISSIKYSIGISVRCVRSMGLEELNDREITQNTPIGERFDLDGEDVVYGGVNENGLALIVAAQDEPNLMTWDEAMQAAQNRNQSQKQDQQVQTKKNVGLRM